MDNYSAIQHILVTESITQLKARHCCFIDTKQWDGLRGELFSADARFDGFGSAPSGADVDTFVRGVANRLQDSISIHQCHMPEMFFAGPNSASHLGYDGLR